MDFPLVIIISGLPGPWLVCSSDSCRKRAAALLFGSTERVVTRPTRRAPRNKMNPSNSDGDHNQDCHDNWLPPHHVGYNELDEPQ